MLMTLYIVSPSFPGARSQRQKRVQEPRRNRVTLRKVVIRQKIGSHRNGHSLIYNVSICLIIISAVMIAVGESLRVTDVEVCAADYAAHHNYHGDFLLRN